MRCGGGRRGGDRQSVSERAFCSTRVQVSGYNSLCSCLVTESHILFKVGEPALVFNYNLVVSGIFILNMVGKGSIQHG